MHKSLHILAGGAVLIAAGLFSHRADAIELPGTQSIAGAIAATDVIDQVHCRPGRWHHRYRPHDGCYRRYRYYSYPYYDPYYSPYYYGRPYYYGPGVGVYGPGISFGFTFGPRHRWRW